MFGVKVLACLAIVTVLYFTGEAAALTINLKNTVSKAGYENVQDEGAFSERVTATLRGCKIGAEYNSSSSETRVVAGDRVSALKVSLVSDGGTWTPINMGDNIFPLPTELTTHMEQNRASFPCFS